MHALTLLAPAGSVDTLSSLLDDEFGALSVTVEDADAGGSDEQAVFDEPGVGATGQWRHARITGLFLDEAAATAAAAQLIAGFGSGTDAGAVRIERIAAVDDRDWVRLTQAQFGPIEVAAGFWIVPTWSDVPAGAARVIRLDPGMAFGTGTHPTTRMCLRWIVDEAAARAVPWPSVLDYGCGSGVLAIAAALFGAGRVDAVDIDPVAVETTRLNVDANRVGVEAGLADAASGRYALVVANILATPLKLLAPLLASRLAEGGSLVLSGILETQAEELVAAYAPWLPLRVAARDDGWILMSGSLPTEPGEGMISR